jgi:hypothetical protein
MLQGMSGEGRGGERKGGVSCDGRECDRFIVAKMREGDLQKKEEG